MRKIKQSDTILSVSHYDMDGVTCQIILANIFPSIDFKCTTFNKLDDLLKTINFDLYDHVFITDIYPNDLSILNNEKIIYLDHHDSAISTHDPKNMKFIDIGQCASSLTKNFVEAYFNIKLTALDELVMLVNDYDMWLHKDKRSYQVNLLCGMYKPEEFRRRFMHGDTNFRKNEIDYINYKEAEYIDIFNNIEVMEFEKIKSVMIMNVDNFINEIMSDVMIKYKMKIVFLRNPRTAHYSIRHKLENLHIGNLLRDMEIGGGHKNAAGLLSTNHKETIANLLKLENKLYNDYPELRK